MKKLWARNSVAAAAMLIAAAAVAGPELDRARRNTATNIARLGGQHNMAAAQRTAAWSPTAIIAALNTA